MKIQLDHQPSQTKKQHGFGSTKALGRQSNSKCESPIFLQLGDINSNPFSTLEKFVFFAMSAPMHKKECNILAGFKKKSFKLMCKGKLQYNLNSNPHPNTQAPFANWNLNQIPLRLAYLYLTILTPVPSQELPKWCVCHWQDKDLSKTKQNKTPRTEKPHFFL